MPRETVTYRGHTITVTNGPIRSKAINRPHLGSPTGKISVYIDQVDFTKEFVRTGRDREALIELAKEYIDQHLGPR